jgi:hypothetical protein
MIDKEIEEVDKDELLNKLIEGGIVDRNNAIIEAVQHNIKDDSIINQIKRLKSDNTFLFGLNGGGYTVSTFAYAALDVLNIEKYKGNDEYVKKLIDFKFKF